MAYNTKAIVRDLNNAPIPQYFNATADAYEPLYGEDNALRVLLYDTNGSPLLTAANPGQVALTNVEGTPSSAAPGKAVFVAGKDAAGNLIGLNNDNWSDNGSASDKGLLSYARLVAFDGGNFDLCRVDAQKNLLVGLRSSGGLEPSMRKPDGDALSQSDPIAQDVNALNRSHNGVTWDRWRNNTETTLLASAARTATTITPAQTNYNGKGVLLVLKVTANPGGAETLTLHLRYDTGAADFGESGNIVTAASNGTYRLMVYPGASAAQVGNNKFLAAAVPRSWAAVVQHSGAGSWTYELYAAVIV